MKTGFRIKHLFLILAVLAAGGVLLLLSIGRPEKLNVHLLTYDGETVQSFPAGAMLKLEAAEAPDGYRFLGWKDAEGELETREYVPVEEELWYAAEYAVALDGESHQAYLFPDENGFFRPDEDISRADAARMLYVLLAAPVEKGDGFRDVADDAPCAEAAAALKTLGVVSGGLFRPKDKLTRGELFDMLSRFYPPADKPYRFANVLPGDALYPACCLAAREGWIDSGRDAEVPVDETISRREVAELINGILGRSEKPGATDKQIGSPVDLDRSSPGYWAMVEACISHQYEGRGKDERWTDSTPVKAHEPGPYLLDLHLYWVGDDGAVLRNADAGNLHFGPDGRYTSGSKELDGLVRTVLQQVWKEGMSREELLRALYENTRDSYSYLRRPPFDFGDTSWLVDEAVTLLSTGKGNCYSYASAFCELARAIGYDAVVYSGTFGANYAPHAWVEMEEDGEPHIYDVEIEMARKKAGIILDMYDMSYDQAAQYTYVREKKYLYYY